MFGMPPKKGLLFSDDEENNPFKPQGPAAPWNGMPPAQPPAAPAGNTPFYKDKDKMAMMLAALSNGFGNMTLRGNRGLSQVNNAIMGRAMENQKNNKTIAMLKKTNPELAKLARQYPQYAGKIVELSIANRLNPDDPEESFRPATAAELSSFGIAVDENGMPADGKTYQMSSRGKLSSVGGNGTNVSITNTPASQGDATWEKALSTQDASNHARLEEAGVSSQSKLSSLVNLERALAGVENQGYNADTKAYLLRTAARFGIDIDNQWLASFDTAQGAANALVAKELRLNKGPQTDFDAQFAQSYTPKPGQPWQTNQNMLNHRMGVAARDLAISNAYQDEFYAEGADQRAVTRKWAKKFNNIPSVVPTDPQGGWSASGYLTYNEFEELVRERSKNGGAMSSLEILELWEEFAKEARGGTLQ